MKQNPTCYVMVGPKDHSSGKIFPCHSSTTASRELTAKNRVHRNRAAQNSRVLYMSFHKSSYKWLFLHLEELGN